MQKNFSGLKFWTDSSEYFEKRKLSKGLKDAIKNPIL